MLRSQPLKRTQGFKRSAPLARAPASLSRSEAPRQASLHPSAPKAGERLPARVRAEVKRRDRVCVVCGVKPSRAEPHHVLPKRLWPEYRAEPANLVLMDPACHSRHEWAFRRIRWDELPPVVRVFVLSAGERARLYVEQTYGAPRATDAGRNPA